MQRQPFVDEHRVGLGLLGAGQQFLDAGQQDLGVVGLGNEIVGAQIQAHQFVKIRVPAGQHQNRHPGMLPELAADLEPVLPGQIDV